MKAKACIIYNPGDKFVIDEVELDELRDDEVLVKIYACSICHSDEYMRPSGAGVILPAILGHEGAGIVEKVGARVTAVKPGDHVAVTVPNCGHCDACAHEDYLSCKNLFHMQLGREDGSFRAHDKNGVGLGSCFGQSSFCEFALTYESSCVKVDEDLPFDVVAPVGCGFSTGAGTVLNFLKPGYSDSIAVFGCGSTGFASIMGAKLAGCQTIIAVGRSDEKLALAKELGATHVINSKRLQEEKGYRVEVTGPDAILTPFIYPLVEEIKAVTGGKGVNYAVVTAPVQDVITPAIYSLAKYGECCITASLPEAAIPTQFMQGNNIKVSSCGMGCGNKFKFLPYLLSEYKKGNFPIDRLLVHYKFDDIEQAFADMESGKSIKPVFSW